ncbi:hypothetical protein JXM83_02290 [Candidatus Woesearchaeota archaeon]|nr:hypothetical protein [Candidatus Woesearchaeota archaeon]
MKKINRILLTIIGAITLGSCKPVVGGHDDLTPPVGIINILENRIEMSYEDESPTTIEYRIDENQNNIWDESFQEYSSSISLPISTLPFGEYKIQGRFVDSYGNESTEVANFRNGKLDSVAPNSPTATFQDYRFLDSGKFSYSVLVPDDRVVLDEEHSDEIKIKIWASPYQGLTLDDLVTGHDSISDGQLQEGYVTLVKDAEYLPSGQHIVDSNTLLINSIVSSNASWNIYLEAIDKSGNKSLSEYPIITGGIDGENRMEIFVSEFGVDTVDFFDSRGRIIDTVDTLPNGMLYHNLEKLVDGMPIKAIGRNTLNEYNFVYEKDR